jgi:hypothetical protein
MINAQIYEMEYSVSPGGVDCWEATIYGYGYSTNYTDFKSAGEALNFLINEYPEEELNINVMDLKAYHKQMADV